MRTPLGDATPKSGITAEQYDWLKARLGTSSDARACVETGVTKDRLRHWKRNAHFCYLNGLVRTDRPKIIHELALLLMDSALDAVEWLLASPRGSDKKAGFDAAMQLAKMAPEGDKGNTFQTIIETLNYRGELPAGVVELLPNEPRRLKSRDGG